MCQKSFMEGDLISIIVEHLDFIDARAEETYFLMP
jgi:hypothetical protein